MIQLHPDCLIFQTSSGENIPCSAEVVTIELVGDANLDPDVVREAAAAVVCYFRNELGREHVSIEEFSSALQRVLRRLGYQVSGNEDKPEITMAITNLPEIASSSGKGFELFFFQRLRSELRHQLEQEETPQVLRFQGLRSCVKQLTGRQRWCPFCQRMNDQIVDYLRECFTAEHGRDCNLVVV
jgi:hypothetical protein